MCPTAGGEHRADLIGHRHRLGIAGGKDQVEVLRRRTAEDLRERGAAGTEPAGGPRPRVAGIWRFPGWWCDKRHVRRSHELRRVAASRVGRWSRRRSPFTVELPAPGGVRRWTSVARPGRIGPAATGRWSEIPAAGRWQRVLIRWRRSARLSLLEPARGTDECQEQYHGEHDSPPGRG